MEPKPISRNAIILGIQLVTVTAIRYLQKLLLCSWSVPLYCCTFSVADFICCDIERLAWKVSVPVEV